MNLKILMVGAALATIITGGTQAAVVGGPTIGGLATFTDTNTGRNWLKLNNFFNVSGTNMIAVATAAGFTVATRADVEGLTNTLPLDGTFATWNPYASVMGQAPVRNLLSGVYVPDPANKLGFAEAGDNAPSWFFFDLLQPANSVANGGTVFADVNLWAFSSGAVVPEPASLALLGAGLAGLGLARRRRT